MSEGHFMRVQIIKHRHWGIDDAKRLRPYVSEAQLVVTESDFSTARKADAFAKLYATMLQEGNMTRFIKALNQGREQAPETMNDPLVAYAAQYDRDAFRARKPRLYGEWWTENESAELREQLRLVDSKLVPFLSAVNARDYSLARNINRRRFENYAKIIDKRDRHMASELDHIAERAERYFGISNLVNVVFTVGAAHAIERYFPQAEAVEIIPEDAWKERTKMQMKGIELWRKGNEESALDISFVDVCYIGRLIGAGPLNNKSIPLQQFEEWGLSAIAEVYRNIPHRDLM